MHRYQQSGWYAMYLEGISFGSNTETETFRGYRFLRFIEAKSTLLK